MENNNSNYSGSSNTQRTIRNSHCIARAHFNRFFFVCRRFLSFIFGDCFFSCVGCRIPAQCCHFSLLRDILFVSSLSVGISQKSRKQHNCVLENGRRKRGRGRKHEEKNYYERILWNDYDNVMIFFFFFFRLFLRYFYYIQRSVCFWCRRVLLKNRCRHEIVRRTKAQISTHP